METARAQMNNFEISKICNALFPDATIAPFAEAEIGRRTIGFLRKMFGGLWVGGRVTISKKGLSFQPNDLNKSVHKTNCTVNIPFSELISAHKEFGVITGIVVLNHTGGQFRFRCYGASRVADDINLLLVS
jgi:hypothetical protein